MILKNFKKIVIKDKPIIKEECSFKNSADSNLFLGEEINLFLFTFNSLLTISDMNRLINMQVVMVNRFSNDKKLKNNKLCYYNLSKNILYVNENYILSTEEDLHEELFVTLLQVVKTYQVDDTTYIGLTQLSKKNKIGYGITKGIASALYNQFKHCKNIDSFYFKNSEYRGSLNVYGAALLSLIPEIKMAFLNNDLKFVYSQLVKYISEKDAYHLIVSMDILDDLLLGEEFVTFKKIELLQEKLEAILLKLYVSVLNVENASKSELNGFYFFAKCIANDKYGNYDNYCEIYKEVADSVIRVKKN